MSTPFFRDFFLRTLSSRSRAWPVSPAEKPIRSRRMPIAWKKGPGYAAAAKVSGIAAFLQSLAQEVKEWGNYDDVCELLREGKKSRW